MDKNINDLTELKSEYEKNMQKLKEELNKFKRDCIKNDEHSRINIDGIRLVS